MLETVTFINVLRLHVRGMVMFLIRKPSQTEIEAFLAEALESDFTYPFIGETRKRFSRPRKRPDRRAFDVDHNRKIIGQGDADWGRAKQAVRDWKMFDLGWAGICWPDTPIEEGRNVAMMASHLGIWSLNACRIVYTFDEPHRFGFAYGTLNNHVECGEERFSVERDPKTGEVWYDLCSFSRPRHPLARLGYPYARYLQKYFVEDSKRVMKRTVRGA